VPPTPDGWTTASAQRALMRSDAHTIRMPGHALGLPRLGDLEAGRHPEPIELGRSHAVGLTEYVLTGVAAAEHGLDTFYEGLIRFRG